jgi:HPr kinase/phosphorylase
MRRIHATCVAVDGAGVLIRGPSGSGKSDLALRLIDAGAVLVADDRVLLTPGAPGGPPAAAPPPALAGRIEVRGIGIVALPHLASAPLALVVDLVAPHAVERLPEPGRAALCGAALPRIALAPFEASAVAKVRLAVRALGVDTPPAAANGPTAGLEGADGP